MIIGILCWADESPHWLSSAISSFAPALDHLVALDGKYVLFPGAIEEAASTVEQSEAIVDTCVGLSLPLTLHRPTVAYEGNEVEKRNLSLKLASTIKKSEDDWYFVFDADNLGKDVSSNVKKLLADAPSDIVAAEYAVYHYWDSQEILDRVGIDPGQSYGEVLPDKVRGIYRALDGLEYAGAHWCLRAPVGNEWIWVWGNPRVHQPYADALDLSMECKVHHRRAYRDNYRKEQAKDYYALRDQLQVEKTTDYYTEGLDGEMVKVA